MSRPVRRRAAGQQSADQAAYIEELRRDAVALQDRRQARGGRSMRPSSQCVRSICKVPVPCALRLPCSNAAFCNTSEPPAVRQRLSNCGIVTAADRLGLCQGSD